MNAHDPTRLLPLKNEILWLLLALHDGPMHGYGLMREVEDRTEATVRIQTGALYRFLHRMLGDGLVVETDAPRSATDARRRYYRITALRSAVLEAELERMRRLVASGVRRGLIVGPLPREAR